MSNTTVKKVRNTPQQRKILGEFGELTFVTKAASLGMAVAKPHGESLRYDFLVDTGSGPVLRVQIKTAACRHSSGYRVKAMHGGDRPYSPSQVDFLVAYIIPEDVWYVIPVRAIRGHRYICVNPRLSNSRGRFERYREAWHLLAPKPLIRRIFAQADTSYEDNAPLVLERIEACSSIV